MPPSSQPGVRDKVLFLSGLFSLGDLRVTMILMHDAGTSGSYLKPYNCPCPDDFFYFF